MFKIVAKLCKKNLLCVRISKIINVNTVRDRLRPCVIISQTEMESYYIVMDNAPGNQVSKKRSFHVQLSLKSLLTSNVFKSLFTFDKFHYRLQIIIYTFKIIKHGITSRNEHRSGIVNVYNVIQDMILCNVSTIMDVWLWSVYHSYNNKRTCV